MKVRAWMLAAELLEMAAEQERRDAVASDGIASIEEFAAIEHIVKVIVPNLVRRAEIVARPGRK